MDDTPAPGWLCARRSRASSHLSAQALGILRCRDVTGQPCIQVIRSVTAAARSASFQAGPLRRWRPPTFLFTPPNLKEDGKSPQLGPSDLLGHPLGHRSALEPGVSRQGHWGVGAPTFLFTPPASSPSLTLSEWGMRGALV